MCPKISMPTDLSDIPPENCRGNRRHHGRQRAVGAAAGAAPHRGTPRRSRKCAPRHRGVRPLGHRAIDALLPLQRELETSGRGTRFPSATAPDVLVEERPRIMEHNIQVRWIGRRDGLPAGAVRNSTKRSPKCGQHRPARMPGDQYGGGRNWSTPCAGWP